MNIDYNIDLKKIKLTKIYALSNSEFPNHFRYIGKTNGTLRNRLKQHLTEAFNTKENKITYKINWIKSEKAKNNSIIITLIDEVTQDQWENSEKYYIKYYKSLGARLTNGNDGGGGVFNKTLKNSEKIIKERVIIKTRVRRGPKRKPKHLKKSYQRKTPVKTAEFYYDEKTGKKILITEGFLARQKAKAEKQVDLKCLK